MNRLLLLIAFIVILALVMTPKAFSAGRQTISLDGAWQITQGDMSDTIPQSFERSIPVPGLADMAKPAFTEVGVESALRKAFWYRKTFAVDGPNRQTAILKINKAQFGAKVWLNGTLVGDHPACFTPGRFDVSRIIRYHGENTLLVRVGANRTSLPAQIPTNTDYEQERWIPGIYDSVSIMLMDNPYIKSVQVAPHIRDGIATVQITLSNPGGAASANLKLTTKECKSGASASTPISRTVSMNRAGDTVILDTIKLDNPRLWSPEDPFLYTLRCRTDGDSVETRFGMREFRYDKTSGKAMLNGRPYYLRGSNFCMFRFFEDPIRNGLPWDRKWVRKLLTLPKRSLHWNSARVCIAPFPEFWYDIADETGWLLQDEFPIWGFHEEWSQSELESQFREWITERWNHPSIAVWDACNETLTPRTGQLISAVRGLDLSNRPWDDGYSEPNRPGDAVEQHPYSTFPLWTGEGWDPPNLGSPLEKTVDLRKPPLVINEYDAFWMQRDGNPTMIFRKFYDDRLGINAAPEKRRALQAYYGAAVTEFWRATRRAAAVQWFCYLTYSRTNGVTGDNFIDLKNLTVSPQFMDYMSNAFSPLAVMIDDTEPKVVQDTARDYQIIITNDLYDAQSGTVTLRLTDPESDKLLGARLSGFKVNALGQSVSNIQLRIPDIHGRYLLSAELTAASGMKVRSRRYIEALTADEMSKLVNIAKGQTARASSEVDDERGTFPASFAVDGKQTTRWSSEFADPQRLMVDLGKQETIARVKLYWEFAYGKDYAIQVSDDGETWKDAYRTDQGKGAIEEIRFTPVEGRYIRLMGTARGTRFGYSLFEFQVFRE